MRDSRERVLDMLEAIAAIERHSGCERKSFEENELLQGWFVRHLQIIGEAAQALPDEIRVLAPDVPWHKIIGMRNILVHGYFEIDADVVWGAATRDAPALKPALERLLTEIGRRRR